MPLPLSLLELRQVPAHRLFTGELPIRREGENYLQCAALRHMNCLQQGDERVI